MISILTPTLNRAHTLVRLFESIHASGIPVQHVIIDGKSTDGTRGLVGVWSNRMDITFLEGPWGQTEALNHGLAAARYDWIGWINSDDRYLPGGLMDLARLAKISPAPTVCYGGMAVSRQNGMVERYPAHPVGRVTSMMRQGNQVFQPATLTSKAFLDEIGGWDEAFDYCQDFWLWAQVLIRGGRFARTDVLVSELGDHPDRMTHDPAIFRDRAEEHATIRRIVVNYLEERR